MLISPACSPSREPWLGPLSPATLRQPGGQTPSASPSRCRAWEGGRGCPEQSMIAKPVRCVQTHPSVATDTCQGEVMRGPREQSSRRNLTMGRHILFASLFLSGKVHCSPLHVCCPAAGHTWELRPHALPLLQLDSASVASFSQGSDDTNAYPTS